MPTSSRSLHAFGAAFALLAPFASTLAQQTFTPKGIVQWGQGGDRERGMLAQMGYARLAQGQFGLSVADLNGDGRPEIIVTTLSACDKAGCPVVALQSGGQNKVAQIFSQKIPGRLAITNEKVNGYSAFAAADQSGAIMKDGAGRLLVYPVGSSGSAQAASPPATQAAPVPPPARPATPPSAATAATVPPTAAPTAPNIDERTQRLLGYGNPTWQTPGAEYLPACLFPACLNMQVAEKTGVGTDKAMVRGQVTEADATRWCALYKKLYRLCVEEEVANNGTAGDAMGRPKTTRIQANCVAGTMSGIDGMQYKYAGVWEDGPGKGGARFSGGGSAAQTFAQQGELQISGGATTFSMLARDPSSGQALAIQWELLCAGAKPPG